VGYLKAMPVGKHSYFYWCERKRDKKRQGGDGKVKGFDFCLGRSLFSSQVAFYCWAGDLPVEPLLDCAVRHWLGAEKDYVTYSITIEPVPVLSFRSKGAVDLRSSYARPYLNSIKRLFADLCRHAIGAIPDMLTYAHQCLEFVREADNDLAEYRRELAEYQADPDRILKTESFWHNPATGEQIPAADFESPPDLPDLEWDPEWDLTWQPKIIDYVYSEDYGERLQSRIDRLEVQSLTAIDECKLVIDRIVQLAPKQRRRETREQLLREFKLT